MKFCIFLFTLLLCASPLACAEAPFLKLGPTPHGQGFFSVFSTIIGALDKVEKGEFSGLSVNFGEGGLYYDEGKGSNWWRYYFDPLKIGSSPNAKECPGKTHTQLAFYCIWQLSKQRCHELISKYIQIRPHILKKIDAFVKRHFEDAFVLGVHYRGTDKGKREAPRIDYEDVLERISLFSYNHQGKKLVIFVATDEEDFIEEIRSRFPGQVVSSSTVYSNNGQPIHLDGINMYVKGEEALIDCILLSRSDYLIRTSSNLSYFSTCFNPDLPVELLNPGILDR